MECAPDGTLGVFDHQALLVYWNFDAVIVIGIFLLWFYTTPTSKELVTPSISATAINSFSDVLASISKKRFVLLSLSWWRWRNRGRWFVIGRPSRGSVCHDGKFVGGRSSSHYLFVSRRSCKCWTYTLRTGEVTPKTLYDLRRTGTDRDKPIPDTIYQSYISLFMIITMDYLTMTVYF